MVLKVDGFVNVFKVTWKDDKSLASEMFIPGVGTTLDDLNEFLSKTFGEEVVHVELFQATCLLGRTKPKAISLLEEAASVLQASEYRPDLVKKIREYLGEDQENTGEKPENS